MYSMIPFFFLEQASLIVPRCHKMLPPQDGRSKQSSIVFIFNCVIFWNDHTFLFMALIELGAMRCSQKRPLSHTVVPAETANVRCEPSQQEVCVIHYHSSTLHRDALMHRRKCTHSVSMCLLWQTLLTEVFVFKVVRVNVHCFRVYSSLCCLSVRPNCFLKQVSQFTQQPNYFLAMQVQLLSKLMRKNMTN